MKIILFTIGSVQNYIAESRKCSDLFNSSKILSDLIKEGMKFLVKEKGEILLPIITNNEGNNAPNYFLANYENEQFLGGKIKEKIQKYYIEKIGQVEKYNQEIQEQLNTHLDMHFVERELPSDFSITSKEYIEIYKELYSYLDSIKNTKQFKQLKEKGQKCSICGKRNFININNYSNVPKNILNDREQLCTICYLKRIYSERKEKKLSTAGITILNFIENGNQKLKEYREFIKTKIEEKNLNLDLYDSMYEENLKKLHMDKHITIEEFNRYEKLAKSLPKDYVIYRMDIDDLGKWMSGKYKKNLSHFYEYQKELSTRINIFFEEIQKEFNDTLNGELIYAGGDDMLALIPLSKMLSLTKKIKDAFQKNILKDDIYEKLTYTQGMFITYYKAPLGELIRVSKEELEKCKDKYEMDDNYIYGPKNATVISIVTEGYYTKSTYFKNYTEKIFITDFIGESMNYFKNSSTFFHDELGNEFLKLDENIEEFDKDDFIDMVILEQKRMMLRRKKADVSDEVICEYSENLTDFMIESFNFHNNLYNYFAMFDLIRVLNKLEEGEALQFEKNN